MLRSTGTSSMFCPARPLRLAAMMLSPLVTTSVSSVPGS